MLRILVVYDITDDKERKKASETCLDYGLDRHQYSVFSGLLKPTHLKEMAKKLASTTEAGKITVIPIASDDWERRIEVGSAD